MKKKRENGILILILSIFLISSVMISVPLVSAGIFSDIGDFFKKLFNIGDETIEGKVGELYSESGTKYGTQTGFYDQLALPRE